MVESALIISRGSLKENQLAGYNVLLTGAGGGIGYEAARSLLWLGARVIIAEVNKDKGKKAEKDLNREFSGNRAIFVHTDLSSEKSVKRLVKFILKNIGNLDVIFNNATVASMGAVHTVGIDNWDRSYKVNLKGPLLLISHFLPDMLKKNSGVIVFVPSSGAAPYMGAYEVFKTSQVELCNTLAGELEGTGVITYAIGPGIVKTETAQNAIKIIAPLYGKSVEEFYAMSEELLISAEEAGAGFAASVALAANYNGLEIGSIQALTDAGISLQKEKNLDITVLTGEEKEGLLQLIDKINATFSEQVDGWHKRAVFERQWVLRDFKKSTGAVPEYFLEEMKRLESSIEDKVLALIQYEKLPFSRIRAYYLHQMDLLKGYEKNPDRLKEYTNIMNQWVKDIDDFRGLYNDIFQKTV